MFSNHRVRLGRSELQVSPICYGSWQLSTSFWGHGPEEEFVKAMRRAHELGINFFDTADAYGNGLSEQVMGKALKPIPRDQLIVATKVYWRWFDDGRPRIGDLSRQHILEGCDASLRRLNMQYIDLYQCHAWDPMTPMDEIVDALELLVKQGKIRAYGTSNWTVEQMCLGNSKGRFSTCQPPYSLIKRGIENDILPYCLMSDTGTLVYSPLQMGLLSGKYAGTEIFTDFRKNSPDYQGERFKMIAARVQEVGMIGRKYELTIPQTIFAATLMNPGITCVIAGIKTVVQIEDAAGAMGKSIDREDYFKIRSLLSV
ncbi:MAG: aldo/keto reductase [Phycisphaeraceae bacterium]|nr:aldo/keto reductase [Phycisphaeraceae bacterium]